MNGCAPLPPASGFIQSVLAFLDCQAWSLGARGWQALAAPGSTLALVLFGFLTLFIALFGYRLLLGQGPDVRTGVVAFVKIGIVFALATSWGAYSTLVYDVVNRGPAELAAEIGTPSGLPGTNGDLLARLDGADRAFVALSVLGEGRPPQPVDATQPPRLDVPAQPYPGFNTYAISASRMLFLIAAVAGLGAVRLTAGLLLAVGPFFIAFLLFENTRSLFEGWVRVLAGAALAALGISIALAVELALIEPWLSDLLARRSADEWLPGMPIELLVVTTSFALIVAAMLYGSAKTALAFRLAPVWQAVTAQGARNPARDERAFAAAAPARGDSPPAEARSRAATVVDAVAASQRRESSHIAMAAARDSGAGGARGGASPATSGAGRTGPASLAPAPLGQSFQRRTRGRVSASAGRRDTRS
ncbi:MAG TPA: type IV secretion system protein [Allosphingosinicella sp.]|nr:type IV secretion system protein [Allosphingosinicella sp.]